MRVTHNLICLIILSIVWSGCISYSYYQSPLNANASTYREMPRHADSVKSSFYASGSVGGGGANFYLNDGVSAFSGSVHHGSNFGSFQAYYGLSAMGGTYDVNRVGNGSRRYFNKNLDTTLINSSTGTRGYFATGAFGGLNVVLPMKWGEWRVVGANVSWYKERGGYLEFRKSLPDSAANYIERRDDFVTLGLSTDFVWNVPNGSFGYKIDIEYMPQLQKGFDKDGFPTREYAGNLAQTFHVENKNITAYLRSNFGYHALTVAGGVNVRLGK